ncbi:hypothetical protein [Luteolibacter sp. Populi]|uniref:hypothetical protein n=1 Tax=Luteolibacter sp. Populi TaxID=3230487 RepID=UPI00346729A4
MEPSESELLQMLEAREREQAASWQGLRKKATKAIFIGIVAVGATAMAIPSSRDLLIALARELPKQLADKPQAAGRGTATAKPEGVKSPEDMVRQAAAIGAHATGGQMPDTKDLEFGVELLNFMTGPKQEASPAPPKQTAPAPATPPKVAGVPAAKP